MGLISKFHDPEFTFGQNHFRRELGLNKLRLYKMDFFITPTSLFKTPIKKCFLSMEVALPFIDSIC
jgi:hypothetical protein